MTVLDRAFSLLEVKSVSDETRTFEGWATTPKLDRQGDIVDWEGLTFGNSIKLLLYHNSTLPVGNVKFGAPTKRGLPFKASIPNVVEPGTVKDRVEEAWHSVKYDLIAAVSIGFRVLDDAIERIETGYKFLKTEILELSLVPIPANDQAVITSFKSMDGAAIAHIKSFDTNVPAATGQMDRSANLPGVTGKTSTKPVNLKAKEAKPIMNATEHVAALEAKHASLSASLSAIQSKPAEEGRTKDASEKEEYTTVKGELEAVMEELKDARDTERLMKATAKPVVGRTSEEGTGTRSLVQSVTVSRGLPKGLLFTRLAAAKICSRLDNIPAHQVAKSMFPDTPEVELMLKAAVASGNTTDSTWAQPLVQLQNANEEFLDLLRPATIIGRIPGFLTIPFNTRIPMATLDPTAYWVGEGQIKPVSAGAFDKVELTFNKAAGIVVMTEELVRFSKPNADTLMQRALVKAVTYLTDRTFVDPTASATGSSPASVTNGVSAIAATGTTADAFRDDFGSLLDAFVAADMDISDLILVMRPTQAMRLGMLRNTIGIKEFPDIGRDGGVIEGVSVITSNNLPATGGSPADGYPIIGLLPSQILLADEGGVTIDMSREASLVMDSAPDSPESASTITRNLWQHNELAVKAERFITWKKARSGVVQYISNAKYA